MKLQSQSICLVAPTAAGELAGGRTAGGGGAERQMVLIGTTLPDFGWNVSFLTGPWPEADATVDPRLVVARAPFAYLTGRPAGLLSDLLRIWRRLDELRPALVGLRTGGPLLLGLLKAWCVARGAKLVLWTQSDGDVAREAGRARVESRRRRLARWFYQRQICSADLLITQTETQRAALATKARGPCVRMPSLAPVRGAALATGGHVLWAGNPSRNKRIELVWALARRLPDCRFVVAMNPGDEAATRRAREAAAALPNVRYLGAVPPHDMERWFDGAAVVLNTSVLEGVPNTFLQAWGRGIPVLSAGVDPDGLVSRLGLGEVVPVGADDPAGVERLAAALGRLMADPDRRRQWGRAGLAYVLEEHAPAAVGRKLSRLLSCLHPDHGKESCHVREPVC